MAPSITLSIVGLICAAVGNAALNGPQVTAAPALLRGRVVNAIDPTSAGQIGVNPVTSDLGDPFSYVLTKLGTANPVVTWDGSVYHVSNSMEWWTRSTDGHSLVHRRAHGLLDYRDDYYYRRQ